MLAQLIRYSALLTLIIPITFLMPGNAEAHCDSMDGPVIVTAKEALETGNVNLVLIWVNEVQEEQIRDTFTKTLDVRNESESVREVADNWFYETLVRLHRESEGASYTGLKPAGSVTGSVIPATDLALETGSAQELRYLIVNAFEQQLHELFEKALEAKEFNPDKVEAGREFVNNYVELVHYVKSIYDLLGAENAPAHSH